MDICFRYFLSEKRSNAGVKASSSTLERCWKQLQQNSDAFEIEDVQDNFVTVSSGKLSYNFFNMFKIQTAELRAAASHAGKLRI